MHAEEEKRKKVDGRDRKPRAFASHLMRWIMQDGRRQTDVSDRRQVGVSQAERIVSLTQHAAEMDPARNAGSSGSMSLMSFCVGGGWVWGESAGTDASRATCKGGYAAMRLRLIQSTLIRLKTAPKLTEGGWRLSGEKQVKSEAESRKRRRAKASMPKV